MRGIRIEWRYGALSIIKLSTLLNSSNDKWQRKQIYIIEKHTNYKKHENYWDYHDGSLLSMRYKHSKLLYWPPNFQPLGPWWHLGTESLKMVKSLSKCKWYQLLVSLIQYKWGLRGNCGGQRGDSCIYVDEQDSAEVPILNILATLRVLT